jgi:DNA-binding NtrC family response regulator
MAEPLVVVVDDDDDNALVMEAALESAGFAVKVALSLREARALLATVTADALVSDYSLGDGNAFELLESLGSRRPRVAILVTGHGGAEHECRSRKAGFVAHFVKPVTLAALEKTLWAALAMTSPSPAP